MDGFSLILTLVHPILLSPSQNKYSSTTLRNMYRSRRQEPKGQKLSWNLVMLPAIDDFIFFLIYEVFPNEFQSFELVTNLILHLASKNLTKKLQVPTTTFSPPQSDIPNCEEGVNITYQTHLRHLLIPSLIDTAKMSARRFIFNYWDLSVFLS